jgi:RNAse (barnase) inhibitor barstar
VSGAPELTKPAANGWQSVHLLERAPDPAALREAGLHVAELDGGSISSKEDLMDAVAAALEFPDYFGGNWDALDECLRDLGTWLPAEGYVVVVAGAEGFWRRSPELAGMLVRAWLDASDVWTEKTTPFHLTFVS